MSSDQQYQIYSEDRDQTGGTRMNDLTLLIGILTIINVLTLLGNIKLYSELIKLQALRKRPS